MLRLQCQGCKHVSQHPIKVCIPRIYLIHQCLYADLIPTNLLGQNWNFGHPLINFLLVNVLSFVNAEMQAFWDWWRQEGKGNFSFLDALTLSFTIYCCLGSQNCGLVSALCFFVLVFLIFGNIFTCWILFNVSVYNGTTSFIFYPMSYYQFVWIAQLHSLLLW